MATAARKKPQPDVIINHGKLKIQDDDVIGRGAFATVYKARHVDWGCYVAYKKLHAKIGWDLTHGQQLRLAKIKSGPNAQ